MGDWPLSSGMYCCKICLIDRSSSVGQGFSMIINIRRSLSAMTLCGGLAAASTRETSMIHNHHRAASVRQQFLFYEKAHNFALSSTCQVIMIEGVTSELFVRNQSSHVFWICLIGSSQFPCFIPATCLLCLCLFPLSCQPSETVK